MRRLSRTILAVSAILLFATTSAGGQPLSLPEAVVMAQQSNRTMEILRVQSDIARATLHLAGDAIPPGPPGPAQLEAQLAERRALAGWRIAQHAYSHTRAVIALQVETSYLAVLQARRAGAVAAEALAAAERQLAMAKIMQQSGLASEFDLLDGRAAVSSCEASLASAQAANRLAEAGFNAVLGRDLDAEVSIIDILSDVDLPEESFDLKRLEQDALTHKFDVKQSEEVLALRQFEYEAAGQFGQQGTPGHDLVRLQVRLAELELELEREMVRLELRQLTTAVAEARARAIAGRTAASAAAGHLRLAELRYQHGAGNSLELSTARLRREQAALQLTGAYHDYHLARARLRLATGS